MCTFTSPQVELRATGKGDFSILRTLFDHPSVHGWGGPGVLSDEAVRTKYCGARWPRVECYLVIADSAPVGLGQLHEEDERGGGIDLILRSDARNRGVGRAAVDLLVRRAWDGRGWRRITVDPRITNVDGIRFWSAVDFRAVAPGADDPTDDDHLLMEWQGT